jgi:ATP-dependent DNA helicase DinG
MSNNSIHDFQPLGWKDTETKKKILHDVEDAINDEIKYILLEAPTGIGKSWIAATVGLWQKEAVILTPQKVLQNQYEENFAAFMKIIKGKTNFPCKQLEDEYDCSFGECSGCEYHAKKSDFAITGEKGTKNEQISHIGNREKDCSYWVQRFEGEIASFSVYNYAMYLQTQLNNYSYEEGPKKIKKILICDEAEQLEDHLSSELSLTLNENLAKKISRKDLQKQIQNISTSTEIDYIKNIIEDLIKEYDEKIDQLEKGMLDYQKMDPVRIKLLKDKKFYENVTKKLKDKFSLMDKHWVISDVKRKKDGNEILIESVHIDKIAQRLFDQFEHVIFISATLNDDIFLKQLGIDRKIIFLNDKERFIIPKFDLGFTGEIILQKYGINEEKIMRIKEKDLFIEFKSNEEKFFAKCEDLIPHESIPIKDEDGKLNSLSKSDKDQEKIRGINRIFTYKFHSYDNPIPLDNRRIEYVKAPSFLRDDTKEKLLPKMVKQIEDILSKHESEKGIIHVTSFEYQKMILDKLNDEFLSRIECVIDDDDGYDPETLSRVKRRKDKDELLKEHFIDEEPVVILSPSCWFGVDLKDDAGRFQIIFKCPKPVLSTKNNEIRNILEYGNEWYDMRTVYQLIQGCGRSIRSVDDYAVTYLLDANCKSVLDNNLVRPWFVNSVK